MDWELPNCDPNKPSLYKSVISGICNSSRKLIVVAIFLVTYDKIPDERKFRKERLIWTTV